MIEERKIIIGLITSTEYTQRIKDYWTIQLFESSTAKRIAAWCMEYFDKYSKAPGREIETIYYKKKENGLPKDLTEEMEGSILPGLSEEYEQEGVNVDYLVDITKQYFNERHMRKHFEEVINLLEVGKSLEAEKLATTFKPMAKDSGQWFDMSDKNVLTKVEHAFNNTSECLIKYNGALGSFWNSELVRGGFVALLSPEKRGKTWFMVDMAMRAVKQGKRVAFFEAGDMNEDQLLIRISIYLACKSNKKEYSGTIYHPGVDCVFNQADLCDKNDRRNCYGVFKKNKIETLELRKEVTKKELVEAYKKNTDYIPCTACDEFKMNNWGTVWLKEIDVGEPLTVDEAIKKITNFFIKYKRQFKIHTTPSGTLTVKKSLSIMDIWEKEGFIPDVVFYDYPDIMTDEYEKEQRTKQNKIWMDMRGVSDIRHCLTITVTQSDADSYEHDLLKLRNFSEDKRKYGHVTAFYGLNQDHHGREKEIGVMRINQLAIREGEYNIKNQVHVLQNLKRGRPCLGSYW